MKFRQFRFWQILALISGAIIACVMALASISYNSTLGTLEPAFALVTISNRSLFEGLALAFDLGMIASVFGFWHWLKRRGGSDVCDRETIIRNRVVAAFCAVLFIIASLFSIHSVRGYIALNITKSLAPAERNKDVYASLKLELGEAQTHLSNLRTSLLKARGRKRTRLSREITAQIKMVRDVRARLAGSDPVAHVSPLAGLEWFIAVTLWFFNATMWSAWFGHSGGGADGTTAKNNSRRFRASTSLVPQAPLAPEAPLTPQAPLAPKLCLVTKGFDSDSISGWLSIYKQKEPEPGTHLYELYKSWCKSAGVMPLAQRKFHAALVELGARKLRDGRNGPILFWLPQTSPSNDMMGE